MSPLAAGKSPPAMEAHSVQTSAKILPMRITAAFFIPGLRTSPDKPDPRIACFFRHQAALGNILLAKKPIAAGLNRVNAANAAERIDISHFVPHDAAGNGCRKASGLVIFRIVSAPGAFHTHPFLSVQMKVRQAGGTIGLPYAYFIIFGENGICHASKVAVPAK
jgi:hypothetical protein